MAYTRPDKIKATAHIETIVHTADLKNGQFVNLGVIDEKLGGEAVSVTLTPTTTKPDAILMTEHLNYGYPDYDIAKQVTKAGKMGRAYIIEAGNTISFSEDLVAVDVAVGDDVAVGVNGLGLIKADGVDDVVIGKVIGEDYLANIGELKIVRFK